MNKLDNALLIISARWKNPQKYKRKIEVKDYGYGHYSVGFDKTNQQILNEIRKDYKLDSQNQPKPKWWQFLFFK